MTTILVFLEGIIGGYAANECMSPRWAFHDGGIRINTRTGETWKMQHATRQWVLYSDAPAGTSEVILHNQGNANSKELEHNYELDDKRLKSIYDEIDQAYGLNRQPPPLSPEELDRLSGVKPINLTREELERKYGAKASPAKRP